MLTRFEQFCSIISTIYRDVQRLGREVMIQYGYKGAFAQYLVVLCQNPEGLSASQLSELCDKDKAAVSRVVAEMQEKGLIHRECGECSVYKSKIKLTEEGQRIACSVCQSVHETVAAVAGELTEEERDAFYRSLGLIHGKLDSLIKDGREQ